MKSFSLVRDFLFATDEHVFTTEEYKFATDEHKFTSDEWKIPNEGKTFSLKGSTGYH